MTQADQILNKVYSELKISDSSYEEKYKNINKIVNALRKINQKETINVKTTGTISERLCELALKTAVTGFYETLGSDWKWIGDFSILGNPFNLVISVKSFKAKERLMSSGTGHILSPTVGWGLFDDLSEWTESRVKGYVFRAFIAIYMPKDLYDKLSYDTKEIKNINGKQFIRTVDSFIDDIRTAIHDNRIDITLF